MAVRSPRARRGSERGEVGERERDNVRRWRHRFVTEPVRSTFSCMPKKISSWTTPSTCRYVYRLWPYPRPLLISRLFLPPFLHCVMCLALFRYAAFLLLAVWVSFLLSCILSVSVVVTGYVFCSLAFFFFFSPMECMPNFSVGPYFLFWSVSENEAKEFACLNF